MDHEQGDKTLASRQTLANAFLASAIDFIRHVVHIVRVKNPARVHRRRRRRAETLAHALQKEFPGQFVRLQFRLFPGQETGPGYLFWWDAPITYGIFLDDRLAFGIGIEIHARSVMVRQLQGVKGVRIPDDLKDWPLRTVSTCIAFAQRQYFASVRLRRADKSVFYAVPVFKDRLRGAERKRSVAECRMRMRRRYDGTARKAGMKMHEDYGEWVNPDTDRSA